MRLHRPRDATRAGKPLWRSGPAAIAGAAVLGVAACVSLVSPGPGSRSVPVVRGQYKNGRDQIVRIALATAAREGPSLGAEKGQVVVQPQNDSFVQWNGKRYRGELFITPTDSGLLVVNRLTMDDYLRGVVPLEIGNRTSAEIAAVQAQAVAARTYAYKHLNDTRPFDMYATVQDQVYGGVDAENPLSDSAIATTRDVVVLYNGQPITTPYHSTCGGSTAGVSEVWYDQPDQPYLRPVSDRIPGTNSYYCDPSPRFSWTQSYDAVGLRTVMEKYLANYTNAPKANLGRITDVRELSRTASGRVAALTVQTETGSYTLRGNDIRFVLRDPKGAILNSTLFSLTTATSGGEVSSLTLNGRGYGHGIGMCQWGAIGRARAGQNYLTILE
ncbi:MAG TPA: SpoIID/LytB domain-containing protein, partial [Gemmatimonadaceae bacterium]|nr:SpoIID/LytB domain-containing protein [Gemmatimonadaceae bacterium]